MRKAVIIVAVALIAVSLAGLALFFSEAGFSGGGRGYGGGQNVQDSQGQRSLWLLFFAALLTVALVVVVYQVLFPKIEVKKKMGSPKGTPLASVETVQAEKSQTLEAVLRVLNVDERKVVDVLASSVEGAMLQRDIRWKTGLSRVKTHRVLARLSARGIVRVEKYYNTNRVTLADWIARKNE
jgi:uncharacterized membrane protein